MNEEHKQKISESNKKALRKFYDKYQWQIKEKLRGIRGGEFDIS
jgi:hypothetical protein